MGIFLKDTSPEPDPLLPHPDEMECTCPSTPSGEYRLGIDEGQLLVEHTACGRTLRQEVVELLSLDDLPVTLTWRPACGGQECDGWHGLTQCDAGSYGELTVRPPVEVE